MMSEIDIVMFAIQAAIRLGRKVQTVFEDEVRDRALILPPVPGTALPSLAEAETFFKGEGRFFVQAPEPQKEVVEGFYHKIWKNKGRSIADDDKIRDAYLRIQENIWKHAQREDVGGRFRSPAKYCDGVNALFVVKQWQEGDDPKRPPVQRIAGTMVEIALDYVKADPTLFGGNGIGNRITRGFLLSLDEVKFAESQFDDLLLDVFRASLDTFRAQADMVITADHVALLLGQISGTLSDGIKKAKESSDDNKLRALYTFRRELLQNVIKTSAQTVSEHSALFLGEPDKREGRMVSAVLKAVLDAIPGETNLFSERALADLYAAGLEAVACNSNLLLPGKDDSNRGAFLKELFAGISNELAESAKKNPPGLFPPDMLRDVIEAALTALGSHAGRLIEPETPEKQLLVSALRDVAFALSSDFHGDAELSAILKGIFSRQQLVDIVQEVFGAVAQNPQGLLAGVKDETKRSALSQIIASVALAAKADTAKLLQGEDYRKIIVAVLNAFALNPDRLLELNTADPRQNTLAKVIQAVVTTAAQHIEKGGRKLAYGSMLVQMVDAGMRTVSKNVDGFRKEPEIVSMVVDRLLCAASGMMANELDAENLVKVFPRILRDALRDRKALDVSDAQLVLPHLSAVA
jgi:hypothetical protein